MRVERLVSVPFPGILFLNEREMSDEFMKIKGIRTLPGDLISQFGGNSGRRCVQYSFRPLPGDLISQSKKLLAAC